ncbi:MAG: alpha-hydroxy acid oxidase [Bacteroidota bacterium]
MSYQKNAVKLMNRYPAIADLEAKAQKRLPFVAWEYLQTGTGDEKAVDRNRDGLDRLTILPRFMKGDLTMNLQTQLLGRSYQMPFGIAPIGLTGLIWPKIELMLAQTAKEYGIPFCLSTVATQVPEAVGPLVGEMGWFQLYPPQKDELRADLLKRARDSGFHTLVLTADVPAPSRRERTRRAGMKMPPKITPRFIWQGITHPAWSIATLRNGLPSLKTVAAYADSSDMSSVVEFVRFKFRGNLDWDYVKQVRDLWNGPMVLKGLLHPEDAKQAANIGVEGIEVSNHGGRQFDGAPAAIEALPAIVKEVGDQLTILFDSGIRSGLDVIRALALGADFVMCGRAFMYGVGALGQYGGHHVVEILQEDLKINMAQLGVVNIPQIKELVLGS